MITAHSFTLFKTCLLFTLSQKSWKKKCSLFCYGPLWSRMSLKRFLENYYNNRTGCFARNQPINLWVSTGGNFLRCAINNLRWEIHPNWNKTSVSCRIVCDFLVSSCERETLNWNLRKKPVTSYFLLFFSNWP